MAKKKFKTGDIVRCTHPMYTYHVEVTQDQIGRDCFTGVVVVADECHRLGSTSDSYSFKWFVKIPEPVDILLNELKKLEKRYGT